LGISVVAEGVETEEQAQRLMELGCDEAQGYLFGRPVSADEVAKLLARFN
jgi:EAL domain-containing protein (putative c-di-GMP-specific phosphodiesterase class I)